MRASHKRISRWLCGLGLAAGVCTPVLSDEVARPLAHEPFESLRQTAAALVQHNLPRTNVGERTVRSDAVEPVLAAANLPVLAETVEELATVPTAGASSPSDLGILGSRVTFGRLGTADRSLASLSRPDSEEPLTLEQVRSTENYFSYRDYVVTHIQDWERLRNEDDFVREARDLFAKSASDDPNHRSREVFARFLSGLDPNTPTTSATATRAKGSAAKTH